MHERRDDNVRRAYEVVRVGNYARDNGVRTGDNYDGALEARRGNHTAATTKRALQRSRFITMQI